ncbi:hypothetical protein BDZ90DRAFT_232886 [Jaminaea rosea]|uniref:Uncharacterized protein n=1 Tax=Jaminaea rosea TaxID=1569628 RepID=A0A316UUJ3_9BASI|nr:hypothetical protein BDZ90DRAFT_232886 [Jaminaea rosea]PWN26775.1 hypothetical protein BDZ90DRAFT_232886 [Jaminaea rosea]
MASADGAASSSGYMPAAPSPSAPRRRSRRSRAVVIALIALALSTSGVDATDLRYNTHRPSTSSLAAIPFSPRRRDSHFPPPAHALGGKRPPAQPTTDPIYFSSSHSLIPTKEQDKVGKGSIAGGNNGNGSGQGPSKGKGKEQQQIPPPDAFPYLTDIGLRHKVPFKSGMPQAGSSWNDAGLRPNVDPNMPSERRPERKSTRKTGAAKSSDHGGFRDDTQASPPSSASGGEDDEAGHSHSDRWTLKAEDPTHSSSSDAEAVALAEEWSQQPSPPPPPGTDPSSLAAQPALLRLSSQLLSSSKQVWKWIASASKNDHDGIALTMLKPKVHRPYISRLPLIPNDSKRDLVATIVGSLVLFTILAMLWNSRVSEEEFVRVKRIKEFGNASRSPEMLATLFEGGEGEEDGGYRRGEGAASVAYSSSAAGRRRRRAATAGGGRRDPDGSGDESDSDATLLAGTIAPSRRPKPMSRSSAEAIAKRNRGSAGWLGGWLGGWGSSQQQRRRATRSDGAIALPLLARSSSGDASGSSCASTPRPPHFIFEDRDFETQGGIASASASVTPTGRRWGLPTPSSLQSALAAAASAASGAVPSTPTSTLPSTSSSLASTPSTNAGASDSGFLGKTSRPFRSLTPQPPQTQRQRERERSRERRKQRQQQSGSDEAAAAMANLSDLEDGKAPSATAHRWGNIIDEDGVPLRSASANSHRSWASSLRPWGAVASGSGSTSSSLDGLPSLSSLTPDEPLKRPGYRWAPSSSSTSEIQQTGATSGATGGGAQLESVIAVPPPGGEWQHTNGDGAASAARWKGKGRDV